ncbi:MAG: hypothetical protein IIC93_10205 [Chloroflexi bacterium]|nr:hypothetical protein [Chloroflexota bacterium]
MALVFRWHFVAAVIIGMGTSIAFVFIPKLLGEGVDQAFMAVQGGEVEHSEIRSQLLVTALLIIMVGGIHGILGPQPQPAGERFDHRAITTIELAPDGVIRRIAKPFEQNGVRRRDHAATPA